MKEIERISETILGLRKQLQTHPLYKAIQTVEDVRIFMEHHVFAVWDFMSLLKSLQSRLTCVTSPWMPAGNPSITRFINEIVLAEESDINEEGEAKSHFEMYLDAMTQINADKKPIITFLKNIPERGIYGALADIPELRPGVSSFVRHTFTTIASDAPHIIASAFTFGREDLIPDIFFEILRQSDQTNEKYFKLRYYLERHIELDGDQHGPLSKQLITHLCENDPQKWEEAEKTAIIALKKRILLWDTISEAIEIRRQYGHKTKLMTVH